MKGTDSEITKVQCSQQWVFWTQKKPTDVNLKHFSPTLSGTVSFCFNPIHACLSLPLSFMLRIRSNSLVSFSS